MTGCFKKILCFLLLIFSAISACAASSLPFQNAVSKSVPSNTANQSSGQQTSYLAGTSQNIAKNLGKYLVVDVSLNGRDFNRNITLLHQEGQLFISKKDLFDLGFQTAGKKFIQHDLVFASNTTNTREDMVHLARIDIDRSENEHIIRAAQNPVMTRE